MAGMLLVNRLWSIEQLHDAILAQTELLLPFSILAYVLYCAEHRNVPLIIQQSS
jgi:hypothetical protein